MRCASRAPPRSSPSPPSGWSRNGCAAHLLSGFPWDLAGYTLAFSDALNQYAAIGGIWGLSLITVAVAAMPAVLWDSPKRSAWIACGGAALAALLLYLGGVARLVAADDAFVPGVVLRIVQPAIAQTMKWKEGEGEQNVALHRQLTIAVPGLDKVSAVIWPETAIPYLLERNPQLRQWLGQAVPPGALLITGALRGEPATGDWQHLYNSAEVLDHDGNLIGSYDKFHLVPLGEYVPLRAIFPFINKITPGNIDFTEGPGPRTLTLAGAAAGRAPDLLRDHLSGPDRRPGPPAAMASQSHQ